MRGQLGVSRRVPDATLRDTLGRRAPDDLRAVLHRSVQAADRRKALVPQGLPFGVVAMDGKSVTLPGWGADYVQRHVPERGEPLGMLRTITSCLLYTSDAADERSSVDLGGRRIIKKKTKPTSVAQANSIR